MSHCKIIIEHCEPQLSKWLLIEYEHSSQIVGRDNLIFTNVKRKKERQILARYGRVFKKSVSELKISRNRIIILDPKADQLLSCSDVRERTYIVVGGILGDHPPRGRTSELITSKMKSARVRSLGPYQFSIDGAVYMAWSACYGIDPNQIKVAYGVEIIAQKKPHEHIIGLPYAYPLVNNKPLISPKLIDYLLSI